MPAQIRSSGILRMVVALFLACWLPFAGAQQAPLKLGIMPFNSPLALIRTHQPLTEHLERQLGRKVIVLTSPDYFTHINQLLAGDFDLAITGPHFGAMASQRGMTLLFRYAADLQPVFVVRDDSTIHQAKQFAGKTLALSSRLSISSIGGVDWLHQQGLRPNVDFRVVEYSSHGAAIAAVAAGAADAAVTTYTPLRQIPPDLRQQVRLLSSEIHMPHLMTLAHERLGASTIEQVRKALLSFQKSPAGEAFFRDTGYNGYVAVTPDDIEKLRPFVDLTVQMMR